MRCTLLLLLSALATASSPGATLRAAPGGRVEDTRGALAALTAPAERDRRRAEEWLTVHLEPGDLPLVAELAATAGIEARSRLVHALGGEDRHLELAVLLATDHDEHARGLGRAAIERMVVRRWGDERLQLSRQSDVLRLLADDSGLTWSIRPDRSTLAEGLENLARQVRPAVRPASGDRTPVVVLDPLLYSEELDSSSPRSRTGVGPGRARTGASEPIEGRYEVVLFGLAASHGAEVVSMGASSRNPMVLVALASDLGGRDGTERLTRWCREVVEYPERPRGRGAARALVETGWPAAAAWLERRWRERGDENALAGLLHGASMGQVAPSLETAAEVQRLLERARADLGELSRRRSGEEILVGLSGLPPVGIDGADLAALVAARFSSAAPGERAQLLAVLEGMNRVPAPFRTQLRQLLASARPAPDPRVVLAAVRLLARVPDPDAPAVESATELALAVPAFELAADLGGLEEWVGWLEVAALTPSEGMQHPAGLPVAWGPALRRSVLAWLLAAGPESEASDAAVGLFVSLANGATRLEEAALGDLLARRANLGSGEPVRRLLETAEQLGRDSARLGLVSAAERVRVFAGLASEAQLRAVRVGLPETPQGDDLLTFAALLARLPERAEMERLIDGLRPSIDPLGGRGDPWVAVAERAADGLHRAGRDQEAEELLDRLLMRARRHVLAGELLSGQWPPPPGRRARSVDVHAARLGR